MQTSLGLTPGVDRLVPLRRIQLVGTRGCARKPDRSAAFGRVAKVPQLPSTITLLCVNGEGQSRNNYSSPDISGGQDGIGLLQFITPGTGCICRID